jgi:hypothetical protein
MWFSLRFSFVFLIGLQWAHGHTRRRQTANMLANSLARSSIMILRCRHTQHKHTQHTLPSPAHPRSTASHPFPCCPPAFPQSQADRQTPTQNEARSSQARKIKEIDVQRCPPPQPNHQNTTTTTNERPLPPSQHLGTRPRGRFTASRAGRAGAWAILPPPSLPCGRPRHLPSVHARGPPPREWELCE